MKEEAQKCNTQLIFERCLFPKHEGLGTGNLQIAFVFFKDATLKFIAKKAALLIRGAALK